jgi:hypothetical protein
MDTDPRYPITLVAAGTAVVTVLVANPAIAKALGTLIADLLGVPEQPDRSYERPSLGHGWSTGPSWPHRPASPASRWDDD